MSKRRKRLSENSLLKVTVPVLRLSVCVLVETSETGPEGILALLMRGCMKNESRRCRASLSWLQNTGVRLKSLVEFAVGLRPKADSSNFAV